MGGKKSVLFVFVLCILLVSTVSAAVFKQFGSDSQDYGPSIFEVIKNIFTSSGNSNEVGNPDTECQNNGFDFGIAKYSCGNNTPEDTGSEFGNYDLNVTWYGCYQAAWISNPAVGGVLSKESTDTFNNSGGNSGIINELAHDLSHITFCGKESERCEIDSDCGEQFNSTFCTDNIILNNITTPSCNQGICEYANEYEYIEDCGGICIEGGECLPVCGNGIVEQGEQCDDGNDLDEDSCSNSCRLNNQQCDHECFVPDTLGDTIPEVIHNSGETTLQQILDNEGYFINATSDQTNIQVWNTTASATFDVKYFTGISSYQHTFGYYEKGNLSTFVPLFKTGSYPSEIVPIVDGTDTFSVALPSGKSIGFAIRVYNSNGGVVNTYKTENALNQYGRDRAVVFDLCDEFVVAFEDWIDYDYQDIIFSLTKTSCGGDEPYCGDGIVQPDAGEQCDDGNQIDGDGCNLECSVEYCGDGFLQEALGEECDDGNNYNEDGCSALCEVEQCNEDGNCPNTTIELSCYTGPSVKNVTTDYSCVDGSCIPHVTQRLVFCGEKNSVLTCEDNNVVNKTTYPGCSNAECFNTTNTDIVEECTGICSNAVCYPVCGNGLVEEGEQCDDGNLVNGDGCEDSCTVEVCIPTTCQELGKVCGEWDDGCGETLNCGNDYKICGVDYGTCTEYGREYCEGGQYTGICLETQDPRTEEICDEYDNDCNGLIDDGVICEDCSQRDSDNDGVNDCDDYCPDSMPNEPVDNQGCDIFQFCEVVACGPGCEQADWRNNEPNEAYPLDCMTVIVANEGTLYPKCVPTEFSNLCAG